MIDRCKRQVTNAASFAFDSTSKADVYAVPTVAVTQDLSGLGIPVVLGVGVSATSGIGVDYKHTSNSLGAAAELINLRCKCWYRYENV